MNDGTIKPTGKIDITTGTGINTTAGLISNTVAGYLYGTTSNIQSQFSTINSNISNCNTYITNLQNKTTNIQYDLTSNTTEIFGYLQIAYNNGSNLINPSIIGSSANSSGYISGNYSGGSGEVNFFNSYYGNISPNN